VILVPGPAEERAVVQRIYRAFIGGRSTRDIAHALNRDGVPFVGAGASWSSQAVYRILKEEKYVGNHVYNRRNCKLGRRPKLNPREKWIRRESTFEPIVSAENFATVQAIMAERQRMLRLSNSELLDRLRGLLLARGRLSTQVIRDADDILSPQILHRRFGSLTRAYELVGYVPSVADPETKSGDCIHP